MKKKIILILLMIFTCFFIFDSVKADMGAPATAEYEVIVKNLEGAKFYDYKGEEGFNEITTIPYDTILTIRWENKFDDVWYGNIDYNEEYGYIKIEDVKLVNESFSLKDAIKLDSKKEIILINKDGGELYSGPSKTYKKLSPKIPTGTILQYEYVDTSSEVWAYVEYNGVKGWLYIYNLFLGPYGLSFAVPTDSSTKNLVVNEDIKLYDYPTTDSTILLDKIPVNTELTCKYSFSHGPENYWCYTTYNQKEGWVYSGGSLAFSSEEKLMYFGENQVQLYDDVYEKSSKNLQIDKYKILNPIYYWTKSRYGDIYYYIEYNGNKGWIKQTDELAHDYDLNKLYYGTTGITVYDSFNCNNKKDTITQNSEFKVRFEYDNKYYIEYNNTSGWILASELKDTLDGCLNCNITLDTDVNIFSDKDTDSQILGTIKQGVKLKNKFYPYGEYGLSQDKWYFIEDNGIKGWINTDVEYTVYTETEIEEEPNELIEKLEKEVSKKSLHPYQIILLCVGGAVIVAITVVVIIILINKRKKVSQINNQNLVNNEQSVANENDINKN